MTLNHNNFEKIFYIQTFSTNKLILYNIIYAICLPNC